MKNTKIIGIVILFLMSIMLVSAYDSASSTPQYREVQPIEKIIPKTEVIGNYAQIITDDTSISVDKFEAKSGDIISLELDSSVEITKLCFNFPVSADLIDISDIKINIPFWYDYDLKPYENKSGNSICYDGISISSDEVSYNASYNGEGRIKYDIVTNDATTLDPYIIGNLSTSNNIQLYVPFDGNINVFSFTSTTNNGSNLSGTYSAYKYNISVNNFINNVTQEFYFDNGALPEGQFIIQFNYEDGSTANSTSIAVTYPSLVWQNATRSNPYRFKNVTTISMVDHGYTQGLRNTWWQDSTVIQVSSYYNLAGMVAGYDFKLNQNANDITYQGNNGNATNVIINASGVIMNSTNMIIIPNITINSDWSISFKAKKNAVDNYGMILVKDAGVNSQYLWLSPDHVYFDGNATTAGAFSCVLSSGTQLNNTAYVVKRNSTAISFYYDGIQQCSVLLSSLPSENNTLAINTISGYDTGHNMNGTISQLMIYNRSLSAQEILNIYQQYDNASNEVGTPNAAMNFDGKSQIKIKGNITDGLNIRSMCYFLQVNNPAVANIIFYDGGRYDVISSNKFFYQNIYEFPYNDTAWNHICIVENTSTAIFYKNGILQNITSSQLNTTTDFMQLGGYQSNINDLNGSMDEFMVFNRALSATEVYILANGFTPLNWINVTDCNNDTVNTFMNINLNDEDTKDTINLSSNPVIQVYVLLTASTNSSITKSFSLSKNSNNFSICLPKDTFSVSNFSMNATIKYYADYYVPRYKYIINQVLTNSTNLTVPLYDLLNSKATGFKITYQDSNSLPVQGVIIDTLRQYIQDQNQYTSVENAITDSEGSTISFLESDSVIYKFNVWQNGVLIYTSPEGRAICQNSPCIINLKPKSNSTLFQRLDNLVYTMTTQQEFTNTQNITFTYNSIDMLPHLVNLSVFESSYLENTTICNTSFYGTSGILTCSVPPQYTNTSFIVYIFYDNNFFGYNTYSSSPTAAATFGAIGLFMTVILYLSLALIGISSPIISIILGIVGLIIAGMLIIFESGSAFGIGSSLIWLIIAGAIIIYKLKDRRAA